jgi:hypothetical protein
MKKFILLTSCTLFSLGGLAQSAKSDSIALLLMDRMTDVIGDLNSCSFTLDISIDIQDPENGLITNFQKDEVYMAGPNKMLVNSIGPKGHREYWYNGTQLAYYSHNENNYATLDVAPTIMETISLINKAYDIEFPAADFFYPAFTDDLIKNSDRIAYLGKDRVNGKECFHILATSQESSIQFWVSNDAYNLPQKLIIMYKTMAGSPQYEATFSNWQINPDLPVSMFNFLPPPKAKKIRILAKNEK